VIRNPGIYKIRCCSQADYASVCMVLRTADGTWIIEQLLGDRNVNLNVLIWRPMSGDKQTFCRVVRITCMQFDTRTCTVKDQRIVRRYR